MNIISDGPKPLWPLRFLLHRATGMYSNVDKIYRTCKLFRPWALFHEANTFVWDTSKLFFKKINVISYEAGGGGEVSAMTLILAWTSNHLF